MQLLAKADQDILTAYTETMCDLAGINHTATPWPELWSQIFRAWPRTELETYEQAWEFWIDGNTDIKKPHKNSVFFINQILRAHLNSTRKVQTGPKFQHHTPRGPKPDISNIYKSWEYQYEDWVNMIEGRGSGGIGKMYEIQDENALEFGLYKKTDFTDQEIKEASHAFHQAARQAKTNFYANRLKSTIKRIDKTPEYNNEALGRIGAYFTRIRLAQNPETYLLPNPIAEAIHQKQLIEWGARQ